MRSGAIWTYRRADLVFPLAARVVIVGWMVAWWLLTGPGHVSGRKFHAVPV